MTGSRLALICDWYLPRIGGVELHLHDLADQLHRQGHEVHIITSTRGPSDEAGIPVHRLPLPWMGEVAWPDPRKVREIARLLERERIELVHSHGTFSTLAIGGLLAASTLGIPSVTTNHSMLHGFRSAVAKAIFTIWSHRATLVTAVSGAAARDIARATGRDDVVVLPNGIDLQSWSVPRHEERTLRITSVGRLTRRKTFSDLVEAIPAVLSRLREPERAMFTMVGDGPESLRLRRLARARKIERHVEFSGRLTRGEVRRILSRSDIFVSTCRTEAFGVALLEARCAGVPVVAMAGGGLVEIVDEGRTGLLARSDAELIDHIVRLLEDETLRRRMQAAAPTSLERFDWSSVVPAHIEVYEEAMRRARSPKSHKSAA